MEEGDSSNKDEENLAFDEKGRARVHTTYDDEVVNPRQVKVQVIRGSSEEEPETERG